MGSWGGSTCYLCPLPAPPSARRWICWSAAWMCTWWWTAAPPAGGGQRGGQKGGGAATEWVWGYESHGGVWETWGGG